MKSSWKAGSDSLLLRPMIGKGKLVGSFGTLDESYSVSVSVSSTACRLDALTGFLDVLKRCTVLSDSSPAKCTFFTDSPAGSDWARCCKRTPKLDLKGDAGALVVERSGIGHQTVMPFG